jgi:hypothetical protein
MIHTPRLVNQGVLHLIADLIAVPLEVLLCAIRPYVMWCARKRGGGGEEVNRH